MARHDMQARPASHLDGYAAAVCGSYTWAPPCTRWSAARTTGIVELDGGLECALFTVRLLRACRQSGVLYTLENPRASALWKWPPLADELRRASALSVNSPQCQYGPPTRSRRPFPLRTTPSTSSPAPAPDPGIENVFKG